MNVSIKAQFQAPGPSI